MPKHTPGPWIAMSNGGYTFFIHSTHARENEIPIARVLADQREGVDPESNARLIAAAPRLLEIAEVGAASLMAVIKITESIPMSVETKEALHKLCVDKAYEMVVVLKEVNGDV